MEPKTKKQISNIGKQQTVVYFVLIIGHTATMEQNVNGFLLIDCCMNCDNDIRLYVIHCGPLSVTITTTIDLYMPCYNGIVNFKQPSINDGSIMVTSGCNLERSPQAVT